MKTRKPCVSSNIDNTSTNGRCHSEMVHILNIDFEFLSILCVSK